MITGLLLWIIVFLVLSYVAWWVCQKFGAPQPVFWLVGVVLLLILLAHIAEISGVRLP